MVTVVADGEAGICEMFAGLEGRPTEEHGVALPARTEETDGPAGGPLWFVNDQASPEPCTGRGCFPHSSEASHQS